MNTYDDAFIPAPGAFPSYEDAASGKAPFPDIPVYSFDPLIIPPPPPDSGMDTPVPIQMSFSGLNITPPFDPSQIARMMEERERYNAGQLVMTYESGVRF